MEGVSPVCSQQVDLINDQQRYLLHIGPVLPIAADTIPLLRRADDDVSAEQSAHVRRVVTCISDTKGVSGWRQARINVKVELWDVGRTSVDAPHTACYLDFLDVLKVLCHFQP